MTDAQWELGNDLRCSCVLKGAELQEQFTSLGGASANCTGVGCEVVRPHLLLPVCEEVDDTMTHGSLRLQASG